MGNQHREVGYKKSSMPRTSGDLGYERHNMAHDSERYEQ
jgi:hypothetical protein